MQMPRPSEYVKRQASHTQPQIDIKRPHPAQRVNTRLVRDIERLAAHGGLTAIAAAVDLFGRRSGFEEELRAHFRKCAEGDPAALTLLAAAR